MPLQGLGSWWRTPTLILHILLSSTVATGGQLFLYDRRICRFFRRDGHNWRKKPDGKTIRETHEKLKGAAGCLVRLGGWCWC